MTVPQEDLEPVEPAASPPPRGFTDREGREIRIALYGAGPLSGGDEFDALAKMYGEFDAADRAQGIPPTTDDAIREWLDTLTSGGAVNLLAWHDESVVGHATLVPDAESNYELAIFVLQAYQHAGIGTALLETAIAEAAERDIAYIWLTVERWNNVAIDLYHKVGFEVVDTESFDLEMGLALTA